MVEFLLAVLVCPAIECHWQRMRMYETYDQCVSAGKRAMRDDAIEFRCVMQAKQP